MDQWCLQAKGKVKNTEKIIAKLQEKKEPSDLPTDLETITDEERLLFRKIGLSMKPYLLLGKRKNEKLSLFEISSFPCGKNFQCD